MGKVYGHSVQERLNRLESEARASRQGRLADYLTRMDFLVLDELSYLPFAQTGGQLLFISSAGCMSVSIRRRPRWTAWAVAGDATVFSPLATTNSSVKMALPPVMETAPLRWRLSDTTSAFFQDQLQMPHIGDVLERIGPDHNQVGELAHLHRVQIKSRMSAGTTGRPTRPRDFQRQYRPKRSDASAPVSQA